MEFDLFFDGFGGQTRYQKTNQTKRPDIPAMLDTFGVE